MFKIYGKRFSFTLVEVIVVCSMIAIMVIGIIFAINRAFVFMDNTRLAVRATNLTREGVEMMYNIRDTNRRKYSGERDKYWMTGVNEGIYVIGKNTDGSLYMTGLSPSNLDDFYSIEGFFSGTYFKERSESKLDFTGTYSYYSGGSIATGNIVDLLGVNGLNFYRIVRVYGVYKKNTLNANEKIEDDSELKDSNPKEMRFCVKVFYENRGYHASELCSIMTNFME